MAGVPIVILLSLGDFIHKPQWNPKHKKVPFKIIKKCIVPKDKVQKLTDKFIAEVDSMISAKSDEILTV